MTKSVKHQRWLQGVVIFGSWTLYALFFASRMSLYEAYIGKPIAWRQNFASWLASAYACAILTPLILYLGNRFPFERGRWRRSLLVHLLASTLFSLGEVLIFIVTAPWFGYPVWKGNFSSTYTSSLTLDFQPNLVTYWTILCIILALNYYRKYRQRELQAFQLEVKSSQLQAQLAQAHLSALKMQLHPHFLFNTLNAIVVLIRKRKDQEAEDMLTGLSELLRYTLESIGVQEVTLKQELQFLDRYLEIEQVRFKDRLKIEQNVEPNTLDALVPNLLLQPLVENAIRHGIAKRAAAGLIEISATRKGEELHIRIRDNGPGLPTSWPHSDGKGIGISNTKARLSQLYGDATTLELGAANGGGTVASLIIPFRAIRNREGGQNGNEED